MVSDAVLIVKFEGAGNKKLDLQFALSRICDILLSARWSQPGSILSAPGS
jgi:hypothetical protein